MKQSALLMIQSDTIINLISCAFTIMALIFTLYFWLLDHLSEDEARFIESKTAFIAMFKKSYECIKDFRKADELLSVMCEVNDRLEIILNYRFWANSPLKSEYGYVKEFYEDSKYLISTLQRYIETINESNPNISLAGISSLDDEEIMDIRSDYGNGLLYIISFIESW